MPLLSIFSFIRSFMRAMCAFGRVFSLFSSFLLFENLTLSVWNYRGHPIDVCETSFGRQKQYSMHEDRSFAIMTRLGYI